MMESTHLPSTRIRQCSSPLTRRDLIRRSGGGFGALALAALRAHESVLAIETPDAVPPDPLAVRRPHFSAPAKRVIFLFMPGGPSQVDTFDPKPRLPRAD